MRVIGIGRKKDDQYVRRGGGMTYLEDGIDEKAVCVGEDEEGGIEAGGIFEELDAAFHGGVLGWSGE